MRILLSIAMMLLLFGCKKSEDRKCWKGHGDTVTETRALDVFDAIEIRDHVHVTLVEGAEFKAEITAGENLQNFVRTKVVNGVLEIEDDNGCNFVRKYDRPIRITVTAPAFRHITQFGTGNLNATDSLHANLLYESFQASGDVSLILASDSARILVQTGPADVGLRGTVHHLYAYHSGTGYIRAFPLRAEHVHVSTYSTGDFQVQARSSLRAELYASGDVYYRGSNLDLWMTEQSSGRLIAN